MNFVKHLIEWMDYITMDERLTPHHVSLYLALFQSWNLDHFRNPVSISRQQIMQVSKIGSVNTYSKCMKELDAWGYFRYEPSYNPLRGSKVYMYRFDRGTDKADGQLTIKAVRPSLNNINSNKQINSLSKQPVPNPIRVEPAPNGEPTDPDKRPVTKKVTALNDNRFIKKEKFAPKEKAISLDQNECRRAEDSKCLSTEAPAYTWRVSEIKQRKTQDAPKEASERKFRPPEEPEAITFFQDLLTSKGDTHTNGTLEGQKFFNYFQSVGWKVGKSKPMKDWKAAARNWLLNAKKCSIQNNETDKQRNPNLHTKNDKNYGEPL